MGRQNHSRLVGVIFVVGSIFGIIFSVGGLVVLWSSKTAVTDQVTGTAALVGRTLTATRDTISAVSSALDQAGTDLVLVQKMLEDVADTLDSSSGMISSTADLVGTNMVDFVNNTQTSLASVENSAKMVDSMLKAISSIPFLGPSLGNGYRPDLPLQDSVANVSHSLEPLPASFTKIRHDLDVSSANVATVKAELQALAKQVDVIQTTLKEAHQAVDDDRSILSDALSHYDRFEKHLPLALNTIYVGVTGVLVWILITQLGMLIHGIDLLG